MNSWKRFCIVGVGGHARTKLIPAIVANGQEVAGLVSRQPPENLPAAPLFATLDQALAALPKDTVIVIATPPLLHYSQTCAAIDAGFDVIVEKPAFVSSAEARDVAARCAARGTVLIEAFMQRHTRLYQLLLDHCAANPVVALTLEFIIPAMPADTFRSERNLASSSLYDIGCYILALLSDLGFELSGLNITSVEAAGTLAEAINLDGTLDRTKIAARIGVGAEYRNIVHVGLDDGSKTSFHPVFYGRQGTKLAAGKTIEDDNAFEAMFVVPREQWWNNQAKRLDAVIDVTSRLEVLAEQLAVFRARSLLST